MEIRWWRKACVVIDSETLTSPASSRPLFIFSRRLDQNCREVEPTSPGSTKEDNSAFNRQPFSWKELIHKLVRLRFFFHPSRSSFLSAVIMCALHTYMCLNTQATQCFIYMLVPVIVCNLASLWKNWVIVFGCSLGNATSHLYTGIYDYCSQPL